MKKLNRYEEYIVAACNLYGMVSIIKISDIYEEHNNEAFDKTKISTDVLDTNSISEIDGYFVTEAVEDSYGEHLKIIRGKPYYIPNKTVASIMYNHVMKLKRYRAIDTLMYHIPCDQYYILPAKYIERNILSTIRKKKKKD